ncbi:MAG: hypothetical protein K8T20_16625 [Planctomycetes bacterium]|nr:hypothetical protein [Planctomycetota bacterium]
MTDHEKKMTTRGLSFMKWRYWDNRRGGLPPELKAPLGGLLGKAEEDMTNDGITVQPSSAILSPQGQAALQEVKKTLLAKCATTEVLDAMAGRAKSGAKKPFMVHLIQSTVDADSAYARLALDEPVLKIVARYLDLVPLWYSLSGWINFPTEDDAIQSQLWHRDPEDRQLLKVFFYLNDVDEKTGPFSYVMGSHSRSKEGFKTPKYMDRKRVSDQDMDATYPRSRWKQCTGPADTMILADTIGFHKGGKPERGSRILVTMTYTSGKPLEGRKILIEGKPHWEMTELQRRVFAVDYKGKLDKSVLQPPQSM